MLAEQFKLISSFTSAGDQPKAIEVLSRGIRSGCPKQVLLGVTGSGKTFTMAQVIARVRKPTLVIAPNKTLAAQLYNEFKQLFPNNAVEYFVSYYDYYQPEAYIPQTDTHIEKDASINEEIERMRLSATNSIMEREDVVVAEGLGDEVVRTRPDRGDAQDQPRDAPPGKGSGRRWRWRAPSYRPLRQPW